MHPHAVNVKRKVNYALDDLALRFPVLAELEVASTKALTAATLISSAMFSSSSSSVVSTTFPFCDLDLGFGADVMAVTTGRDTGSPAFEPVRECSNAISAV